jgi:hypothetical protein
MAGQLPLWADRPPVPASLSRPVASPDDFPDFTIRAPAIARRGDVAYITLRVWRPETIRPGLELFKRVKHERHAGVTDFAAAEIADFLIALAAPGPGWSVVNVACGHSQRRDCFGKRLAQRSAELLGLPMLQAFDDRLRRGSSHPRRNASLPPLSEIAAPAGPCAGPCAPLPPDY